MLQLVISILLIIVTIWIIYIIGLFAAGSLISGAGWLKRNSEEIAYTIICALIIYTILLLIKG